MEKPVPEEEEKEEPLAPGEPTVLYGRDARTWEPTVTGIGHYVGHAAKRRRLSIGEEPVVAPCMDDEEQGPALDLTDEQASHVVSCAMQDNRNKYLQDISSEDHKERVNKNALPVVDEEGRMVGPEFSAQIAAQRKRLVEEGCPEKVVEEIIGVVREYPKLFDGNLLIPSSLDEYVVELREDCGEPPCAKARPLPRDRREWLDKATKNLEKVGIITRLGGSKAASVNPMYLDATATLQQEGVSVSPIVLAQKAGKKGKIDWRMCMDLSRQNKREKKATYRSPALQELREVAQDSNSYFVLDLMKGYFQIPLAEESKKHFVFICPLGEGNAKFQLNRVLWVV